MCWKDLYFNEALGRACKSNGCTNLFMILAVSLSVFFLVVAIVLFHSVYCVCLWSLRLLLMWNISGADFYRSLSCTKMKAPSKSKQFCKAVRVHACPLCTPSQLQYTSFLFYYLSPFILWRVACESLDCGRKSEELEGTHADTRRTCQFDSTQEVSPGISHCTTTIPYSVVNLSSVYLCWTRQWNFFVRVS